MEKQREIKEQIVIRNKAEKCQEAGSQYFYQNKENYVQGDNNAASQRHALEVGVSMQMVEAGWLP